MARFVSKECVMKTELPLENIIKFHNNSEPDVVLKIDDVNFHCHRGVLSRQSQYFQAMFSRNFAEKNKDVIELKEVDSVAMDAVLSAVYSDELPITVENSLNLLQTASMLQFNQVEKQCIDFLGRSMNPDLSVRIYQIADRLSIKSLYNKARCYVLWEFSSVKATEAFLELPLNYLKSYLSSDLLRTTSEVEVFEAVICWVEGVSGEGKTDTRLEFLPELLYCIRFVSLHADDIRSFLLYPTVSCHQNTTAILKCILSLLEINIKENPPGPDKGLKEDTSVQENSRLKNGMEQLDDEAMTVARQLLSAAPRLPPQVPCVVGHIGIPKPHVSSHNEVPSGPCRIKVARKDDLSTDLRPYLMYLKETVDENGKKITELKPFLSLSKINFGTTEVSGYKVTSIGKDVILLGGQHYVGHGDCIKSVWRFRSFGEPGEGEWFQEASLLNPRRHHSMCTLDDDLYLIGGFGRHRVLLDTMERYHVPTGTWHSCRSLPEALYSAATCVFDGSIYVLGSQLYCYHPPSDMWSTINELSLPKNTGFSSAMPYKDYIFLTGIYTTKLMRFNPRHQLHYKKQKGDKESWTLETVGNFRNKALNTCIVGHKIYSFALPEDWQGFEDECPASVDSKSFLEIETYNIMTESFEVVWTGSLDKINLDGGGIIADFMTQHCAGCFSMIKF